MPLSFRHHFLPLHLTAFSSNMYNPISSKNTNYLMTKVYHDRNHMTLVKMAE